MTDDVYSACADQGNSERFACELPKGHDGPHKALRGTEQEMKWGHNGYGDSDEDQ